MSTRTRPSQHKPYPELAEPLPHATPYWIVDSTGKPWLPTNGLTSLSERKLYVPLAEGAISVARHELGHVRWSPEHLPEVEHDVRALMAVEDARLNLGLRAIGVPVELTPGEQDLVVRLG